ncbi:MAG: hypothetical protein ACTSWN_16890 [Promethearchaeota archaeon]
MLGKIGLAIKQPENAHAALDFNKVLVFSIILLGLFLMSRMITIALDISRPAIMDLFVAEDIRNESLSSWGRGSMLHSLIIASCGFLFFPVYSIITTALMVRSRSRDGMRGLSYKVMLVQVLVAITIRLPIYLAIPQIIIILRGFINIFDDPLSWISWTIGFLLALLDAWRITGKLCVFCHKFNKKTMNFFNFVILLCVLITFAGIIYIIGGFG